jgi:ectoine hydroxylase-related dioxygenase (phytanoyl-CoA dioxygenase family)
MTSTAFSLERFQDPTFWLELNSGLSIAPNPQPWSTLKFSPERLAEINAELRTDGYFQLESLLPEIEVFLMAVGIESLFEADIPPIFAFVYDEYWQVYTRLATLLSGVLGDGYCQLPSFWAWYVTQDPQDSGWGPHRDRMRQPVLQPDHSPNILTVWLPLSDATPLNGCMYVLPASADPNYLSSQLANEADSKEEASRKGIMHVAHNLQSIRALPATAGSILGWTHVLFHWGSRSSRKAETPRISLSVEFQRGDIASFDGSLLDPLVLPSFPQRLRLIAQQILKYHHMYHLPPALEELAKELNALPAGHLK